MMTTLHYYGYYPNRVLNKNTPEVKQLPYKKTVATTGSKPINLSTSYNGDVISYAKNLSESINSTKQSAGELLQFIAKYISDDKLSNTNTSNDEDLEIEDTKEESEELSEDLEGSSDELQANKKNYLKNFSKSSKFTLNDVSSIFGKIKNLSASLNKTSDFKNNSSQSNEYNDFADNISNIVQYSPSLNEMGISYKDGQYEFNESKIESLSVDDLENMLASSYSDLLKMHDDTSSFLSKPLSNHMQFKSFSYYYSYSTGIQKNSSFNLFSSGTLLNLQL